MKGTKPTIYYTIEDYNMTQSDEYPDPSVWVIDCRLEEDEWDHDEIHFVKIEDKEEDEEEDEEECYVCGEQKIHTTDGWECENCEEQPSFDGQTFYLLELIIQKNGGELPDGLTLKDLNGKEWTSKNDAWE
jgi:hypothetical protein